MVAASIIALIATIVLSSLGLAKSKARDSQRITELQSVQKALELNYVNTGSYPQTDENGWENSPDKKTFTTMTGGLQQLIANGAIPSIPYPPNQGTAVDPNYYYRTVNKIDDLNSANNEYYGCGGKTLGGDGGLPYIIYFYSEVPQNLPELSYSQGINANIPVTQAYCLTNS